MLKKIFSALGYNGCAGPLWSVGQEERRRILLGFA